MPKSIEKTKSKQTYFQHCYFRANILCNKKYVFFLYIQQKTTFFKENIFCETKKVKKKIITIKSRKNFNEIKLKSRE